MSCGSQFFSFHIGGIFNYRPTILLHVTGGLLENKALFFGGCLFGGAWIPRKDQQVASTYSNME